MDSGKGKMKTTTANIVLAIVGLTVVNSTFVTPLGICANVELKFFKSPTIANTYTVMCQKSELNKPKWEM